MLISPQFILDNPQHVFVNGLACFSRTDAPRQWEVALDQADGFERATVCTCALIDVLDRRDLSQHLGQVSAERERVIRQKLMALFGLK